MIKVIHSHPVWLPLTQSWMYHQVEFLPSDQVESHIVCERTQNLDVFRVPHLHALEAAPMATRLRERVARRLGLRTHLAYLVAVGRREQVDILHSHFGTQGWFNIRAARAAGMHHVVTFYGSDISLMPKQNPIWKARYAELFQSCSRVLCEGPHMAEEAVRLGCPREKTRIQHLGVPLARIPFRPRRLTPGAPLRVLIASSFREKKGIPDALRALALASNECPLEVTVIGDEVQGDPLSASEAERIHRTLAESGLAERVNLRGFQPLTEFWAEAQNHHVFLSPSVTAHSGDTEGGAPLTIIETAASGMLVISTNHCDIPHVLGPDGGLLVPERDVEGLAQKLIWAYRNPTAWGGIAAAARERVEGLFSARTQGTRLAELYEEVCAP